ncbi:cytochrome c maturation protein CcmE [Halothermothrix orenii]|uniref:Putative cytochrome c-type biogenesis protein CcmE n=1 Tax=Halothermothrix orenii (strain H 168 / OCM 544 / DSM 9562) TaxID=373903 RepID=B8D1Q8_HALOH|nr:cytochrome c maturation protein CcmE [Halothermothrix orenii]ACL69135.1 putative cytochrome c-type biogenesis protein CcmE [Halothermothrix orenii H 168]
MKTKTKVIILTLIIVLVVSYTTYISFNNSATYYYTISEARGLEGIRQHLRIKGNLIKDSVKWSPDLSELKFTLTDGQHNLKMIYSGVVPDNFKHSREVIVEGKFIENDVFRVTKLMLQCPSKYEKGEE